MTNDERLDDIDRQLAKLFSLHGLSWKQIEKRAKDNAPQPQSNSHTAQEFGGTYRPKPHEVQK
jgi:hypothetical protein